MGRGIWTALVWLTMAVLLAACGAQENDTEVAGDDAPEPAADEPVGNACPAEGCEIEIVDAVPDGDELGITWRANFMPDLSRNHIHVFWDTYSADQVSADADARGVEQGAWVVTDAYPDYVTESAVSVAERGDSTTICVTAADRDHAVIDSSLVDCHDVSNALDG